MLFRGARLLYLNRLWVAVAVFAVIASGLARPAAAESFGFRQAVAEAASADPALAEFYRTRDYQPLWTTAADSDRREALFTAFAKAADHGLPAAQYGADKLRKDFATLSSERARGLLEVAVSAAFLSYAQDVQTGLIDPKTADTGIVREVPLRDPLVTLRSFAASNPREFIHALPPQAPQYAQLMKAKLDLERAVARGSWGPALNKRKLQPGDTGPEVVALRNHLMRMGYLDRTATASYDGAIQKAVQKFQSDNGLSPDGITGEGTIDVLNEGARTRLKSVMVAMERLRWMNGLELGRRHVWVNLPDFTAKIVDDGKVTFETVTVVGMNQSDRRSPEFSDMMEFMVINPTWNVPRSITVKEYLPMLRKNPNAAGHLKIVDRRGRVVDRGAVDFTRFTERNFPFSMSQPPSDRNALGLVKFMFPNKWNIYLHDTPSKSLFDKEVRAYSHGCIRLGQPFDFAYALLAPQSADPVAEFERHLRTGSENTLPLATPIPVHLVYFTAWPSPRGRIEYRRDVYGRDARVFDALTNAGVVLPDIQG